MVDERLSEFLKKARELESVFGQIDTIYSSVSNISSNLAQVTTVYANSVQFTFRIILDHPNNQPGPAIRFTSVASVVKNYFYH